MKLLFAALFMLLGLPVRAATVNLAWDLAPGETWSNVRLYEKIGTNYTLKIEVAGTATTASIANVSVGTHIYIARAYAGGLESEDSNTATANINPSQPGQLRIVAVTIKEDGTVEIRLVDPADFFRG